MNNNEETNKIIVESIINIINSENGIKDMEELLDFFRQIDVEGKEHVKYAELVNIAKNVQSK